MPLSADAVATEARRSLGSGFRRGRRAYGFFRRRQIVLESAQPFASLVTLGFEASQRRDVVKSRRGGRRARHSCSSDGVRPPCGGFASDSSTSRRGRHLGLLDIWRDLAWPRRRLRLRRAGSSTCGGGFPVSRFASLHAGYVSRPAACVPARWRGVDRSGRPRSRRLHLVAAVSAHLGVYFGVGSSRCGALISAFNRRP